MADENSKTVFSESDLQDLVIESDSGARKPGGLAAILMLGATLFWSLFQLWIASPIPYTNFASDILNFHIFNSTDARYIHLTLAMGLAFLAYPATKKSPRSYIPTIDWVFFILSVISIMYLYFLRDELANRTGLPTVLDIAVSVIGIFLLLEAARRTMGPPLVLIAVIFLFYTFAGNASFLPDVIAHKGQSLSKVASHQWLSTEGVFGVALGVSTDFVFLFVLFGSLLDKAGAGNYFIKLSFALLGHMRGGPAKAAVLSSAMTGIISGSSIANVVTTGTFTIPLMKRVGFSREQAGAVEVSSSVNGQIMPPVMGAAAFLMVEYVGVSYAEIVKAAFIPAVISYIGLLYIVHLEAVKSNMRPIPKNKKKTLFYSFISSGIIIFSIIILSGLIYFGIGWMKNIFGDNSVYVIVAEVFIAYIGLLFYSSKYPPLEIDNPNEKIVKLPEASEVVRTGLHYLLPIVILVWCLMVEKMSPGLSAFWATAFMSFILLTQKPILAFFRKEKNFKSEFMQGMIDWIDGLITGARNMIGIGIATAAAGIIVGSVSLTGIGQIMTELVELISGGSFLLVLLFTGLISLILGMGLPTTANYIVVASLMAPVIEELGRQNGILVPLIAIHLFVFYFGIMADITPPVGLASFAAAAISGGDPIRTGLISFMYSIRTVILPFIFIYNKELLLYGVDSVWYGIIVFIKGTVAVMVFAAATQNYFITRNKIYETIALFIIAFAMFRPGFFVNIITPEYKQILLKDLEQHVGDVEGSRIIRFNVTGQNNFGDPKEFYAFMKIDGEKNKGNGQKRLSDYGVTLDREGSNTIVSDISFGSDAEKDGFDFDDKILSAEISQNQINRNWIFVIAMFLLVFVIYNQRRRNTEIVMS